MISLLQMVLLFFQAQAFEIQFSGLVSAEEETYFAELSAPTRKYDHILYLQPELDLKFNKMSRMHFKPLLRANLATHEKPERLFLNVQEAYWEIKKDTVRFRLGQNIYNWGALDGYSTLDVVNGRALFNPLQADKRGAPTVDLQYDADWFQFQALYIPWQTRTLLPSSDSRWLPREFLFTIPDNSSLPATILLPKTFDYYFPGYHELDDALKNNYGLRLTSRWNNLDMAAMYFEGSSTLPQISPLATFNFISLDPKIIQATTDVGLVPTYYRQRTTGGSLIWAPSDIIYKIESTYVSSISKDPALSPWAWQNGAGVEIPWNIGSTTLTMILQGYYGENKGAAENLVSSSGRLFDRAAVLGTRWAITSDTAWLVSYLYDYKGGSYFIHSVFDSKFTDKIKWELSGDMIEGDADTFLGTYKKNDRVCFKLSYLW